MQSAPWDELNTCFAPFHGTAIGAVRADLYFNLSNRQWSGWKFRAKSRAYPLVLLRRAVPRQSLARIPKCDLLMICDYAAEPGFGTLRPLLKSDLTIGFVATYDVLRSRAQELSAHPNVHPIAIDALSLSLRRNLLALVRRVNSDSQLLKDASRGTTRSAIESAGPLLRTMLVRAYLYEAALAEVIEHTAASAIVLHNDFTTLSNTAVSLAARLGIPEYTLQHGFPSQEYFPTSSSRYLVWGNAFSSYMSRMGANPASLTVVGAPRLDSIATRGANADNTRKSKPKALFLSQTHTHLFTTEEHLHVLSMLDGASRSNTCDLTIRLHPQETTELYKSFPNLVRAISSDRSLADSIGTADLVLSVNSTALLEAMLLHKPCIQLSSPSMEERLGILRLNAPAQNDGELAGVLRHAASPETRHALLNQQSTMLEQYVREPGHGVANAWKAILSRRSHQGKALAG